MNAGFLFKIVQHAFVDVFAPVVYVDLVVAGSAYQVAATGANRQEQSQNDGKAKNFTELVIHSVSSFQRLSCRLARSMAFS